MFLIAARPQSVLWHMLPSKPKFVSSIVRCMWHPLITKDRRQKTAHLSRAAGPQSCCKRRRTDCRVFQWRLVECSPYTPGHTMKSTHEQMSERSWPCARGKASTALAVPNSCKLKWQSGKEVVDIYRHRSLASVLL